GQTLVGDGAAFQSQGFKAGQTLQMHQARVRDFRSILNADLNAEMGQLFQVLELRQAVVRDRRHLEADVFQTADFADVFQAPVGQLVPVADYQFAEFRQVLEVSETIARDFVGVPKEY